MARSYKNVSGGAREVEGWQKEKKKKKKQQTRMAKSSKLSRTLPKSEPIV